MRKCLYILSALIVFVTLGCAMGTDYVRLTYLPGSSYEEATGRNVVLLLPPLDKRSDFQGDQIGAKKDHHGIKMGEIRVEGGKGVADLTGDAINNLVQSKGYKTRAVEFGYPPPDKKTKRELLALLKVSINKFDLNLERGLLGPTMSAESNVDLVLMDPITEKIIWEDNVRATYKREHVQVINARLYNEAADGMFKKLMYEIDNSIPWSKLYELSRKK
ncbi:MAG: hypothetical protein JW984_16495 [Deltaproteobacteria bacterium]|uniref:Uncharacterized protein n=1 Tax=Candidatus Zymogenus saltonus TaxID=2844893 RepID=A0A9D8KJV8_9DELT|nr:hypothetical protein [Candidatus Zymogenus saltonus]